MTDVVERRMVDLHEWARTQYSHPGMRGRTSIKVVLDGLWKSDAVMRSHFEEWSGLSSDESRDPYAALPAAVGLPFSHPGFYRMAMPARATEWTVDG